MAYISGNISNDGRIIVYDINTNSLVHDQLYSAGAYEILGLDPSTKTIVAVNSSTGESLSYGNIVPIDEGFDWGLFTGDDFNGTNGDSPNETYWNVVGDYVQFDIQSNQLYQKCNDGQNSWLDSNFKISGDFDIKVNFSRDVYPWQGSGYWNFFITAYVDADNWMRVYRGVNGNTNVKDAVGYNDGVYFSPAQQNINYTNYKIRIYRSGSTWTGSWGPSSPWNDIIVTQNNMPTTPITVQIGCNSGTYNQGTARSQYWNDFDLTAGTPSAA